MNDFLNAASSQNFRFDTTTNRYIIGPSVELRLPFGLGIELDVLYRHFGYSSFSSPGGITATIPMPARAAARGSFRWWASISSRGPLMRPYVEAGVSWDRLSGLTQAVTTTVASVTRNAAPPRTRRS